MYGDVTTWFGSSGSSGVVAGVVDRVKSGDSLEGVLMFCVEILVTEAGKMVGKT